MSIPCDGSLRAIVPFAGKERGKERVRSHGLRSDDDKTFPESLCLFLRAKQVKLMKKTS